MRHESNLSQKQLRQFEVKGYVKMIERILDVPVSGKSGDPALTSALDVIKSRLAERTAQEQKAIMPAPEPK